MNYVINTEVIKKLRLQRQLTLVAAANAIGLTRADQYLLRENGQYQFKATELPALADLLGVPMEKLFIKSKH